MRWLAAIILALWLAPALAVEPTEMLDDPVLEARARDISRELRCLVCQNQSIDDSNAPLAADLRVLVRERLIAGDSDEDVMAFVTSRYGDFVRLRPPVQDNTYLLWFGPVAVLVIGVAVLALATVRRRLRPEPDPLTPDERRRVEALLAERDEGQG